MAVQSHVRGAAAIALCSRFIPRSRDRQLGGLTSEIGIPRPDLGSDFSHGKKALEQIALAPHPTHAAQRSTIAEPP